MMISLIRTALAGLVLSLASVHTLAADATGAGASFPAPVYAQWAAAYQQLSGDRINYQSIGSGAGIKQIRARTIDFGASDMPLADAELNQAGLIQFPTVIGGVVPVVNLHGIGAGQMKLTGALLAQIYLGKVTHWNDAALVSLNPGLALPDARITVVRRADASGTSFLFTNYLGKLSPGWKAGVGEGTAVKWPIGLGGKGNEGVSGYVKQLANSIGYVEYAYAVQNRMATVLLKNHAGRFVAPDESSFKAAAAGADWSRSFHQVLTDQPGPQAWPITGATFILLHQVQEKPATANTTLRFFDWAYRHGDPMAAELGYVALPASVKALVRQQWARSLVDSAGKALIVPVLAE